MELKPLFQGIADAIREKDGTTEPIVASEFPARINAIPTGSSPAAESKDVNFYDYDGTLLYSYTPAEAQALTALPDGPTHPGLVFQGWNWTLEKVQALTRPMNVGAMYITDDGKTRLKIHIWDTARSNVPLYIQQTVANGVTIDWGDGSPTETLDGTGNVNTTHQYAAAGDYTISLAAADGCRLGLGDSTSYYCVLGSTGSSGRVYCNLLQEVNIGHGVTSIGHYAFNSCYSLSSITIPDSVTSIGHHAFSSCYSLSSATIPDGVTTISGNTFQYCCSLSSVTIPDGVTIISGDTFRNCYSLSSVTIPDGVTTTGSTAFYNCYSLSSVTIPDGVPTTGNSAFYNCYSLSSVTIPNSVTVIGANTFANCTGMAEYHLKPTVPPRLVNADAFNGIPSDCIIYVPAGSLEAYKTAANWSTYADYMREE